MAQDNVFSTIQSNSKFGQYGMNGKSLFHNLV